MAWGINSLPFFIVNNLPRLEPGFKFIGFEEEVRIAGAPESALLLRKCLIKHKTSRSYCLLDPVYQRAMQVIEHHDCIKRFASQRIICLRFKIHFPQRHHSGIRNFRSAETGQLLTINVGEYYWQATTEEISAVSTRAAGKIENAVRNLKRFKQCNMPDE